MLKASVTRGLVVLVLTAAAGYLLPRTASTQEPAPNQAPAAGPTVLPAIAPPADLPVIAYETFILPFPSDPEPTSRVHLKEGAHPNIPIAAYDAPGGKPLAMLEPAIRGVPITMPIVRRESGWIAVLLPSANRMIGWLPPGNWSTIALRDQLVVSRGTHQLTWYRDGVEKRMWSVTLGMEATPTPLGRSFILGRSSLPSDVYADTNVFALGSVPEYPENLPPGLRGAHTGIHTWHDDVTLGQNASDGCIRLTKSGQDRLLKELVSGTSVVVVDEIT